MWVTSRNVPQISPNAWNTWLQINVNQAQGTFKDFKLHQAGIGADLCYTHAIVYIVMYVLLLCMLCVVLNSCRSLPIPSKNVPDRGTVRTSFEVVDIAEWAAIHYLNQFIDAYMCHSASMG